MGQAWRRVVESGAVDDLSPRCSDPPPEGLLEGIRLFNTGEYYECHKALEAIWLEERDPVRYLYQGILQVGVAFHHLGNGNFRGARLLLENGIAKLDRFQPACMTVDTRRLLDAAQACHDHLVSLGPDRIGEFDWTLAPKVRLVE